MNCQEENKAAQKAFRQESNRQEEQYEMDESENELLKIVAKRASLPRQEHFARAPPNDKKDRKIGAKNESAKPKSKMDYAMKEDDSSIHGKALVSVGVSLEDYGDKIKESHPGAYPVDGPHLIDTELEASHSEDASCDDDLDLDLSKSTQLNSPLDASLVTDDSETWMTARVSLSGHEDFTIASASGDEEQGLPPPGVAVAAPPEEDKHAKTQHWIGVVCILLMLVIILLLALGLTGVLDTSKEDDFLVGGSNAAADLSKMTTLQRIQTMGQLRCAEVFLPNGFMYHDSKTGRKTGFFGELCHALAAALSVEAVFVPPTMPWAYLQQVASHNASETVDVSIIGHSINMERSVSGAMAGVQEGLRFSTPMLYGGLKIGGDPFHITQCVDKGLKHIEECDSIKVCISNMTAYYDTIHALMPSRFFVIQNPKGIHDLFDGLLDGSCNVMVQGVFQLSKQNAAAQGLTNFSVSQNFFSAEPLAMVTKTNDPEFSDFVNSVLQSLLVAEQQNITKATAASFPQTDLFGPKYKDAFRNGELYSQFLEKHTPRSSLNLLNKNVTGLLSSFPWGRLESPRGDRPLGSTLQSIMDRGVLRCGIQTGRPGFAERLGASYSGMEIDLCVALASGLFQGDTDAVDFVELSDSTEGYIKLALGELDVAAGSLWSVVNDIREPVTGKGFAFSQPYFYGYSAEEDNFALATNQGDNDWTCFVFWTISSLLYAEEHAIHSNTSNLMPEQFLFGSSLKRMLRDIVLVSGSYGDIYARHVEPHFPRSGRNLLNLLPNVGPQHYPLPGFFP